MEKVPKSYVGLDASQRSVPLMDGQPLQLLLETRTLAKEMRHRRSTVRHVASGWRWSAAASIHIPTGHLQCLGVDAGTTLHAEAPRKLHHKARKRPLPNSEAGVRLRSRRD